MTKNVEITMAANSQEVQRALDQMNRKVDQATSKMERMRQGGKRASKDSADTFGRAGTAIARTTRDMITSFTGVVGVAGVAQKTLQALKHEIEKFQALRAAARAEQVDFGVAVKDTRAAFREDETLKESELEAAILDLSAKTNALPKDIAVVLQTAFSAKGGETNRATLKAAEQALLLNPRNVEQATTVTGRLLDISNAADGMEDMAAAAGLILNMFGEARVTSPEKIGANLVPGIKSLVNFNNSIEDAAELLVTFNRLQVDEEGRLTRTQSIGGFGALNRFNPQPDEDGIFRGKDEFGEFIVPQEQIDAWRQARSQGSKAQLRFVQENETFRRLFLQEGKIPFQEATREQFKALLRGTREAKMQQADVEAGIFGIATPQERARLAEMQRKEIESQDKGQVQPIVAAKQESEAAIARQRIRDLAGGRQGSAEAIEKKAISEINLPGFDYAQELQKGFVRSLRGRTAAGESPETRSIAQLQMILDELNAQPGRADSRQTLREAIATLERQRDAFNDQSPASGESIQRAVGSVVGAASVFGGSNPEMAEMLKEMREINRNTREMSRSNTPRPTQRQSSRLSRSE